MIYLCANTVLDDVSQVEGSSRNPTKGARHLKWKPDNTNFISDPTDFVTGWTNQSVGITNDYAYTPDNDKIAGRMIADANTAQHGIYYTKNDLKVGDWLRASVLVRYVNYDDFALMERQASWNGIKWDIGANALHTTSAIEDYVAQYLGDGWYLFEMVWDADSTRQDLLLRMTNGNSNSDWAASGSEEIWMAEPYFGYYQARRYFYSNPSSGIGCDKMIISGAKNQLGRTLRVDADASYTPDNAITPSFPPVRKGDWAEGAFGTYKCAKFTAADSDYFVRLKSSGLGGINEYGANDWWWAGWVKLDTASGVEMEFFNRYNTGANRAFWMGCDNSGDPFYFIVSDGSSAVQLNHTTPGNLGGWHFLCYYHEDGVGVGISLDGGAFQTAVWTTGAALDTSTNLYVNRTQAAANYSSHSMMCWATGKGLIGTKGRDYLYNSGVPMLYDDTTGGFRTHHQLVSYWNMTEASGTRVDSHGDNDLTDTNSVGSSESIIKTGIGALSLYSSDWTACGLNDDDIILNETITSQDVIGLTVGDGASVSETAHDNAISKFYVSDSQALGSPKKNSVSIVPNWTTFEFQGVAYKIRETLTVEFEHIDQDQMDAIEGEDRMFCQPIYLYDDGGHILLDKCWHCVVAHVEFIQRDNDYYLMNLIVHRLREYA